MPANTVWSLLVGLLEPPRLAVGVAAGVAAAAEDDLDRGLGLARFCVLLLPAFPLAQSGIDVCRLLPTFGIMSKLLQTLR